MPPEPEVCREVRAWLGKAAMDVAAGRWEGRASPPFCEDMAFHAQQAVEKALKGYLTFHGRRFRKTHSLIELGEECVTIDASLESVLRRAGPLSEYAWRYRYPGEPEPLSLEEAEGALDLAAGVLSAIGERLPPEARI